MRVHDDGTIENLGRIQDDVHERVRVNNTLRARMALRQQFGDLDAARTTLIQLVHALEDLDDPEATPDDTEQPGPAQEPAKTQGRKR